MEGKLGDLEEVFAHFQEVQTLGHSESFHILSHRNWRLICTKNDLKPPYDFDRYAKPFFPVAERLESLASQAEEQGDTSKASELYLRAACVYRTAKQPSPSCDTQRLAWQRQRVAYYNGAKSVHHS